MKERNFIKLAQNCYWDPHEEVVYLDRAVIPLSENKTRCLKLFIYYRGKPLKDIEIFDFVFKDDSKEFTNKTIRSLISNLRNKLPCLNIINHYGGFYSLEKYREPTPDFQEYLLDILDQAKNGITITDPNQPDNPIIYVNEAFASMFGYSPEEVIGKNCRFLQGDDRDQSARDEIKEALRNQQEVVAVLRNYHKNGNLIYNEVQISPIFDKHTLELKYFLGIQKDITELHTLMLKLKKESE
ncbi:helix-turn-helix domain-containing protein [Sulfurimonas marina]|uniref:PAS domain-containing protein n=1 Tax=Sulfurimonas marina TaxID=2590551 RepID=A0A7M1AX91_9BACT|nr:helix-turn-helix domain-containing protein [Sulfurimonas marina]QOP42087.1 PAS domain-containing protein [Sulfurimonas marina]